MKRTRIAINGFGRIGRLILRAYIERNIKDIEIVAINDLGSIKSNAHLLNFEQHYSVYLRRNLKR